MAAFKEMLKYLRSRQGLSQSELANKLGISKSTISMYEVGKREPDFETLETIADFFNVDINFLLGRAEAENTSYYLNQETAAMAQQLFENKDLRVLFDAARDAAPEDLKTAHDILMALKRKERGNTDDTGC